MLSLSGAVTELSVGMANTGSQTIGSLNYQATVIQGSAQRTAGAMPLACPGAGWENLPPFASCSQSIWMTLTNNMSGSGTLVPGPATFQVTLLQGTTVLNTRTSPVTIVDGRFTSVTPSPNPSRIGGAPQPFTVTVSNAGGSLSNVFLGGRIRQGAAVQGSVTASINCGGGLNVLPSGACTISGTYRADTIQSAPYLVPGPATLYFTLKGNGGVSPIDSVNVPITLVGLPTIGTVTPASAATIGFPGPIVNYTATIDNPGPIVTNATVKVRLIQGATNREANSGPEAVDCGAGLGTLPAGSCTFTSIFFATNTGVGVGQLVPGAATLQIQLSDPVNGLLQTRLVPVTLVGP
jgi:hypothetical protein